MSNAEGQRIFALYEQNRGKTNDLMTLLDIYATAGVNKFKVVGDVRKLGCVMWRDKDAHHCITDVPRQRADWAPLVASNQRFIDRYRRLWTYPLYRNSALLAEVEPVNPLLDQPAVRHLFFTSLALQIDRGDVAGALRDIESDLAFWRHLLATRDIGLGDKMVFTMRVRSDLEFISEILRTQILSADQYDSVSAVLAPNEAAERNFDGVWENEIRGISVRSRHWAPQKLTDIWQADTGHQTLSDRALSYLLYRHNAQANSNYRHSQELSQLDQLPCAQMPSAFEALQNAPQASILEFLGDPLRFIYDSAWPAAYLDYPIRLCVIEGMQRIVRLQLLIRRNGVAESNIPSFISSAGLAYSDPFTEQPMRWDSSTHSLDFDPHGKAMSGILPWPI